MSDKFELGPKQRKWIEALRSGEYEQGKGHLCQDGKFCCLGVANEVLGLNEMCENTLENTFEKLALNDDGGRPKDLLAFDFLWVLNDDGLTFEQIADLLEQHPEQYFTKSV